MSDSAEELSPTIDSSRYFGNDCGMGEKIVDVGRNSVSNFYYILQGLISNSWTGSIEVNTNSGKKHINMHKGKFTAAFSSLIDDRLGEILYRHDMVTVDNLMEVICEMTPNKRIGQIFIQKKIITYSQLWYTLREQIINIVKSIFMDDSVSFMLQRQQPKARGIYAVIDASSELLENLKTFNLSYLQFRHNLSPDTILSVQDDKFPQHSADTFWGEMIKIVDGQKKVGDILQASKLHPAYTISCLMDLVAMNICHVDFFTQTSVPEPTLDMAIDKHNTFVYKAVASLRAKGMGHVVGELIDYSSTTAPFKSLQVLLLDCDGEISNYSASRAADHCSIDSAQTHNYIALIDCIDRFLLQAALDFLAKDACEEIVGLYNQQAQVA